MALFSSKVSLKSMIVFCRQMAHSYDAGLPILSGLKLAADATHDRHLASVVSHMHESISRGSTLYEAAQLQQKHWPTLFVELLGSGETGGRLKEVLYNLADHYERQMAIRRKIVGAIIYPVLQLSVLWLVMSLLTAISRMQAATHMQFDVNKLMSEFIYIQMVGAAVAMICVGTAVILSRMGMWKWVWGAMKTFVWPFGGISRKVAAARFARSLGLLLGAGIPAKQAVERAARTTDNAYVSASLLESLPRLDRGLTLTESLAPSPYLNSQVLEMLQVGEQSGTLEKSMLKAADQLDEQAAASIYASIQIGKVVIFLVIACIIGAFVINFWSNYYGNMFKELNI
ncbi:MAG: type II secretion system F family protein [Candidatus Hydrogenedentes bacterium]|nr:type II secretion system F family protein [Candidatus Hydrogenedentota bacterium]